VQKSNNLDVRLNASGGKCHGTVEEALIIKKKATGNVAIELIM